MSDAFRKMLIPRRAKNAAGQDVEVKIPMSFFQATYFEKLTLATNDQGHKCLGVNSNPSTPKNYTPGGKNPLQSQRGQILGITGVFLGPAGIVFNPQTASGDGSDLADKYMQWVTAMEVKVLRNSQPIHQSVGLAILPEMPVLYQGATPFAPAVVDLGNGSPENRQSAKRGIYFHPPIDLDSNSTFGVELKYNTAVDAALNTFQLLLFLTVHEFPSDAKDIPMV